MNLNEYQSLALRTAGENKTAEHDLLHAGMGVITEGAEFLDVLKKEHAYGKPRDMINLHEEIGDVLWYCALACRGLGTTLEAVAQTNILKLQARYPDRFTEEHALVRDLDAERTVLEESTTPRPFLPKTRISLIPADEDSPSLTTIPFYPRIITPAEMVEMSKIEAAARPIQLGAGLTLSKSGATWSIKSPTDLIVAQTKPGSTYLEEIESIDTGTLFAAQQILNTLAK